MDFATFPVHGLKMEDCTKNNIAPAFQEKPSDS
jgi:hypothetical protein